jgi:hypothetical protein
VSKKFGEWHQKTNKREDTNKLTLLVFKIIAILHNILLTTFITLLELSTKASLGIDRRTAVTRFADVAAIKEHVTAVLQSILKEAFADSFQNLYERCEQCVVKYGDYIEGQ